MKILVASDDERKINEIKDILKEYEIISLKESGIELNAEEIGQTFEQNSKIRAMCLAKYTKEMVLAYSEGLWIDCLDGFPGIKTYRILGKDATDEERNAYLLRQLEGKDIYQRIAEVVTAVTVIRDGEIYTATGEIEGYIAEEPKGRNGIGFEPIFDARGGKTLAEMGTFEKNRISSLKKAIKKLQRYKVL